MLSVSLKTFIYEPPHLAEAAFPQDSQKGEVGEFDLVEVAGGQLAGVGVVSLGDDLLTWA